MQPPEDVQPPESPEEDSRLPRAWGVLRLLAGEALVALGILPAVEEPSANFAVGDITLAGWVAMLVGAFFITSGVSSAFPSLRNSRLADRLAILVFTLIAFFVSWAIAFLVLHKG